ncbi:polysaccharide deacetylase [Agrobacterium sp. a22-2]|uniref:polysaccharide deacetylase family protein n=1 Tax=Agrobacterium sp. a22-2 TaxID=2283840 RepID=UPI001445D887|nr:polysaccharide deacetylase family protein [Agrobacterium sp. a22-2]NKN39659.1 polysaccharide deacetylase [Agrobacterium sp. a22-2]
MFRTAFLLSLPLALALSPMTGAQAEPADGRPKQMLIVSFDGVADNRLWVKSRDIARRSNAHFTYFLSCAHLIPRADARTYQAPGQKPGRSNVGFAPDQQDVAVRLDQIWQAHLEGHEIGNHTCGHFDGRDWSKADWLEEFKNFDRVVENAWTANGVGDKEPQGWADFVRRDIRGMRAPYLSETPDLVEAEKAAGFAYDASPVARGPQYPEEDGRLARFGLPLIPEGPNQRRIVGMDYNLFVRHSAGLDHPSRSAEFEERAYQAFRAAFDTQYDGERLPLQLGFHFVEMNGGAYWRAMERLVTEVCPRPDVACVTYSQALEMSRDRQAVARASGL